MQGPLQIMRTGQDSDSEKSDKSEKDDDIVDADFEVVDDAEKKD